MQRRFWLHEVTWEGGLGEGWEEAGKGCSSTERAWWMGINRCVAAEQHRAALNGAQPTAH